MISALMFAATLVQSVTPQALTRIWGEEFFVPLDRYSRTLANQHGLSELEREYCWQKMLVADAVAEKAEAGIFVDPVGMEEPSVREYLVARREHHSIGLRLCTLEVADRLH